MQDFRKLKVWNRAHELALEVYALTRDFPKEERYGLRSQLRGSSSSIGMNLAEGCGRNGDKELARFLHFAMGSASELEYQLLLSHDLGLLEKNQYPHLQAKVGEVKKMLASLLRKLRADS